jgi:hypothetical protein
VCHLHPAAVTALEVPVSDVNQHQGMLVSTANLYAVPLRSASTAACVLQVHQQPASSTCSKLLHR